MKLKISLNPIPSEKITSKYRIRGGQTVVITGHISVCVIIFQISVSLLLGISTTIQRKNYIA